MADYISDRLTIEPETDPDRLLKEKGFTPSTEGYWGKTIPLPNTSSALYQIRANVLGGNIEVYLAMARDFVDKVGETLGVNVVYVGGAKQLSPIQFPPRLEALVKEQLGQRITVIGSQAIDPVLVF